MSGQSSTDTIEREIQLPNPRSRVWRALTDSQQFSSWFGMRFDKPFEVGAKMAGIVNFKDRGEVAFDVVIEAIEPEHRFAYRWHPYAVEANVDYSKEPMTLVEFTLDSVEGGTLLKVVESGFDKIPVSRRTQALEMNTSGWNGQMKNIAKYLAANS
jgi:uncharacterized protein YndB with AHSA1/START domain